MDKRTTDIVSYLTVVGWIIAFVAGDRTRSKFHLNQSLVLWLACIVWTIIFRVIAWILFFPFSLIWNIIGWIVNIAILILWILGLVHAIQEQDVPLPIIGGIVLLH